MDYFIDLGAGWFLFEDSAERQIAICDGLSRNPDHYFGPAAWGRKPGPISGLTIAEAQPSLRGQWHQTGDDEWKWFLDDDRSFSHPFDEETEFWPCQIMVKATPLAHLLETLAGRIISSQAELEGLIRQITANLSPCEAPGLSAPARMAAAKFRHPHIFGDI